MTSVSPIAKHFLTKSIPFLKVKKTIPRPLEWQKYYFELLIWAEIYSFVKGELKFLGLCSLCAMY